MRETPPENLSMTYSAHARQFPFSTLSRRDAETAADKLLFDETLPYRTTTKYLTGNVCCNNVAGRELPTVLQRGQRPLARRRPLDDCQHVLV